MKKLISALAAAAMLMSVVPAFAQEVSVTADKTAQWTNQEKSAGYDLKIHGWETWETAAYIGFTLPENFNSSSFKTASIKLDTKSVSQYITTPAEVYLYEANYSAFENNMQYEGSADAPQYTEKEILSFENPRSTGEFSIDISDYMLHLPENTKNVAFRLDVKSQNTTNDWQIGSLNNGGKAPEIVFSSEAAPQDDIVNPNFSDGLNGWSVTDNVTADNGKLNINGKGEAVQKINGLENGVYNLNVYTTGTDISGAAYVYAKTDGYAKSSTAIPVSASETKIVVPNIKVENGACEIGIFADETGKITVDTLSLSKTEESRVPFMKGGEISKLTYVEDMGAKFYRADGTEADALQIMAENGFNLARIRVLNDPGKGHGDGTFYLPAYYQTVDDCLELARRAKSKGMKIQFTFAYSDYWSDGGQQFIPHEWLEDINKNNLTGENMAKYLEDRIYTFTKDVMNKLIAQDTCPDFVSIGNEMQYGMLFGAYQNNNGFYNKAAYIARFANAGAKAVRETAPNAKIILHSDNGGKLSKRPEFIKALSSVDFDVIGVSYYPFYNADVSIETVVNEFASLINQFDKDVIIMETGYNWTEFKPGGEWDGQLENNGYYQNIYGETENGQRAFLTELYAKLKQVAGGRCIGDLYWDPVMVHSKDWKIGWAIRENDDVTDSNVVPNSTIFDFDGKAVPGQIAMKYNTDSSDKLIITGKLISNDKAKKDVALTVNGKTYTSVTDKYGEYIVAADYPIENEVIINADGMDKPYVYNINAHTSYINGIDIKAAAPRLELTEVSTKDGVLSYTVQKPDISGDLFVAVYDGDGALMGVTQNTNSGTFNDADKVSYVKAFLWSNGEPRSIAAEWRK